MILRAIKARLLGQQLGEENMKAMFYAAIPAVLLGGCASTQKVLDSPVTETFQSVTSANEVAFCLANKNNTAALDRDNGAKVILLKNGYGGVSMAFTVYPDGTGSRIEYRKAFGTIGGAWKQCVGLKPPK